MLQRRHACGVAFARGVSPAAKGGLPSMLFSQPLNQTPLSQLRFPKPSYGLPGEELEQEEDIPLQAQTTEEAIQELNALLRTSKKPTISQFNQAIALASEESKPRVGRKIFLAIERAGVRPNAETFTRLLDGVLREKLESQQEAMFYINKMQEHNLPLEQLPEYSRLVKHYLPQREKRKKKKPEDIIVDLVGFPGLDPRPCVKVPVEFPAIPDAREAKPMRAINPKTMSDLERTQRELEMGSIDRYSESYLSQLKELRDIGLGANLMNENLLLRWFEPLCEAIKQEQHAIETGDGTPEKDRLCYGPYLAQLRPEKLAVITIHHVLSKLLEKPEGADLTEIALGVGDLVQLEVSHERLLTEGVWKKTPSLTKQRLRKTINKHARRALEDTEWGREVHAKIGSKLVQLLLTTATVVNDVDTKQADDLLADAENLIKPAFWHEFQVRRGKKRGVVRISDAVLQLVEKFDLQRSITDTRYLPMLVPPQPWVTPHQGGYLTHGARSPIMRSKEGLAMQLQVVRATPPSNMSRMYEGLNLLSALPWIINPEIYEIVEAAWKAGGDIADLPARVNQPMPRWDGSMTEEEYKKQRARIQRINYNLHSLRCDTIYKLQVAKEFLGKKFYVPNNIDFRGRVYPIPPHLNHLGSDMCRSLLMFAEGRPLGPRGLHWLKIQLSNLYGNDKVPFQDRVAFTERNMENIYDSAKRPLTGNRWWLEADKPWQCLGACFELVKALNSPNPEEYVCHLAVQQDGSCNGLQHYAALGGDELGGQQVNLTPSERPQDVYSGVVALVNKRIEKDAEAGDPVAQILLGKVDRKVIKQTVMTSVYGVTFIGAKRQIENQLKDKKVIADEDLHRTALYLAHQTLGAIKEMFSGAKAIMAWLNVCAKTVALSGKPVTWTTPLGLPVVQPYRKKGGKRTVMTVLQTVILAESHDDLPLAAHKQKAAFPPNYVHSLDATHMYLTCLACHEAGLTYASVHDSYWTHPCSVDVMNRILREKFVELHTQPLLEDLRDQFVTNYPTLDFPPVPERGSLDLRLVLKSPYFFQ